MGEEAVVEISFDLAQAAIAALKILRVSKERFAVTDRFQSGGAGVADFRRCGRGFHRADE